MMASLLRFALLVQLLQAGLQMRHLYESANKIMHASSARHTPGFSKERDRLLENLNWRQVQPSTAVDFKQEQDSGRRFYTALLHSAFLRYLTCTLRCL